MVGPDGVEPSTPRLSSACSNQLSYEPGLKKSLWGVVGLACQAGNATGRLMNRPAFALSPSNGLRRGNFHREAMKIGGAGRIRTGDPLLAKHVLCQLSYDPMKGKDMMYKRTILLKFTLCDQSRPGSS